MKHFVLVVLLLLSVNWLSAQKWTVKENVELSYTNPDGTDSTSLKADFAYYKTTKKPFMDSVNRRILEFFKYTTFSEGILGSVVPDGRFVLTCFQSFAAQNLDFSEEDYFNLWFIDATTTISDHKKYVTLMLAQYNYAGGAHPNSYSEYFSYDKKTGKRLLLSDFFSNVGELTKIAEPYFRSARELAPDEDLTEAGFWFESGVFQLNDNFWFENDQLYFFFNSYEITAYAGGPTLFSIPLDEIKALLIRKP